MSAKRKLLTMYMKYRRLEKMFSNC